MRIVGLVAKAKLGEVTNEQILEVACEEALKQDWSAGVQAAVAERLNIAPSTIHRRFKHVDGGFKRALTDWVLDPDGQDGNAWSEELAERTVEVMAEQDTIVDGLMAAAKFNWSLIRDDDRMYMQMLLWSRVGVDPTIQARMKKHYDAYDRIHRTLWQDILTHIRTETGKRALQREGLTEAQLMVVLDALVEGLVLRSFSDPEAVTDEMYGRVFQALAVAILDFDGDLLSIADRCVETIDLRVDLVADSAERSSR